METVQQEAEYRANGKVVEVECYDRIRRGNGAVLACFVLLEPALDINLPDEVVEHPTFKEITTIGVDLICWSNVSFIVWTTFGLPTQVVYLGTLGPVQL